MSPEAVGQKNFEEYRVPFEPRLFSSFLARAFQERQCKQ